DHDQVRPEVWQPRQYHVLDRGAKLLSAITRTQRRVHDGVVLPPLAHRSGAGVERHLVGRGIHDRTVGPEDPRRAVAVVYVEVDHGGTLDAVLSLGVARGDGRAVEKAESHRPRRFGVVTGGPRR